MKGKGMKETARFDKLISVLSRLSKTKFNYWAEFFLDIPLGVALIILGLRNGAAGYGAAFVTFAGGLLFFSFFEYAIHRWLFHGSVPAIVASHRSHHDDPSGYDATPFFIPALILLSFTGLTVMLEPANFAYMFGGSVALGYVTYGLSHFAIHHHRFHAFFARRWAAHHLIHHRHSSANFGVTSPLWDFIIRTSYPYERIKK